MLRTRSFDVVNTTFDYDNTKFPKLKSSVGAVLHDLEQDRAIRTDPDETRRRRTIKLIQNEQQSWGFTLQTYGIRNKRTQAVEIMSYVDYVEIDGAAWVAGMRRGDIILSVNGESVEPCSHRQLINKIQSSGRELRLVVLFEDCCQKVELHERYLRLKRLLSQKVRELRGLEAEEKRISQGMPLSRLDIFRQSVCSSSSSDWDIYSQIVSPTVFDSVPVNRFAFRNNSNQSVSDVSMEGSSTFADSSDIPAAKSEQELDCSIPSGNSEEDLNCSFTISNSEEDLDCSVPMSNSKKKLEDRYPIHSSEEELDIIISIPETMEEVDSIFPKANFEDKEVSKGSTSSLDIIIDSSFSRTELEDNIFSSSRDMMTVVTALDTRSTARPGFFNMELESECSSDSEKLSDREVNVTCDCPVSFLAEVAGQGISGDYTYSTNQALHGSCQHRARDNSQLKDALPSPWLASANGQQSFQISQERGENFCMVSDSLLQDAVSTWTTSTLPHHTEAADVNSTKRLINGVLVNDRNYSTRL